MGRLTTRMSSLVRPRKRPVTRRPNAADPHRTSIRRIAISSGAQVVGAIGSGIISILAIRLLTSRLGPYGYGQYIILLSFVTGAALIVDLGLNGITYRDLAKDPGSAGKIIGANLGLRCALCFIATPVVILLVYFLYPQQRAELTLPSIVFSFDIFLTVLQTTLLSHYGSRVRGEVTATILFLGRLLFLSAVYISSRSGIGLDGIVICFVAADAVTAALSLVLVHRSIRISIGFQPRVWWLIFKRAAPLGVMQLVNTLYLYVDSIMLSILATNQEVAFYALGFGVIAVVGSFSNMFASALVPGLAVAEPETVKYTVERSLYAIVCVSIPIGIGGALLAGVNPDPQHDLKQQLWNKGSSFSPETPPKLSP